VKPKLITVLVVLIIVTAGVWLASRDNSKGGDGQNTRLTGEVVVSLPGGAKHQELQPDQSPPDFYILKEKQPPGDEQISTLSEFNGKYVLINFWTTWCPPCRAEMPELNQLYLDYGRQNVEFLFINLTSAEKSTAEVENFLVNNNYAMPVYLDQRGEVADAYHVSAIPTTVIIDPTGQVVYNAAGQIAYEQAKSLLGF